MKRFLALMMALLCIALPVSAESAAEIAAKTGMASEVDEVIARVGSMTVVNCEEWVSLREGPSSAAARLTKVPLGARVTACTVYSTGFTFCKYNGIRGYILSEYLTSAVVEPQIYDDYIGSMQVVNCEEWVSLRASANKSSARLAQVPLGAVVYDCTGYYGDFIGCTYEGQTGYILAEYLGAVDFGSTMAWGDLILQHSIDGCTVNVYRQSMGEAESIFAECLDSQGGARWAFETSVPYMTELTVTDAFIGGTAEQPMVMVHNSNEGLFALDFFSGQQKWMLPKETVSLGGSISAAVSEDGTMYIGGYYGPDPVAISASGELLWQSDARHDAYWLYDIQIAEGEVIATYDCIDEHEAAGRIGYGLDGSMRWVEWF